MSSRTQRVTQAAERRKRENILLLTCFFVTHTRPSRLCCAELPQMSLLDEIKIDQSHGGDEKRHSRRLDGQEMVKSLPKPKLKLLDAPVRCTRTTAAHWRRPGQSWGGPFFYSMLLCCEFHDRCLPTTMSFIPCSAHHSLS